MKVGWAATVVSEVGSIVASSGNEYGMAIHKHWVSSFKLANMFVDKSCFGSTMNLLGFNSCKHVSLLFFLKQPSENSLKD